MRVQPIIVVQQLKPLMRTQSSYALRLGRYKVRSLMQALQLKAKRPKQYRYPVAGKPSQIAPNSLNRQFNPPQANVNWTGDITPYRSTGQALHSHAARLVVFSHCARFIFKTCNTAAIHLGKPWPSTTSLPT